MNYEDIFNQIKFSTQARINLGNAGSGLPTKPLLNFRLDHALAKDAVYKKLDIKQLQTDLTKIGLESTLVHSAMSQTIL